MVKNSINPDNSIVANYRRGDLRDLLRRIDGIGHARFATIMVLIYVALSLFAYLPAWPGDPHRLVGCACGDPVQQAWFLGWLPWAMLHGHNLFFTNWMEYPPGVNLSNNTEMPLLGLLAAPITLTAGAVSSYSFLLWLSYPVSATAAFFVFRRWTRSNLAAGCGGLLYGFSAYVVGQGLGHINLAFVPLPPLIFMTLHEVLVQQQSSPRKWGVLLGLLVTSQYLISPEVLTTTAVVALCGVIVLALARRRYINLARLLHAWRALWPGVLIAVLLLGYPIYFQLAGPLSLHGPAQGGLDGPYRADLLGTVVPTSSVLVAPAAAIRMGDGFISGAVAENGSYLGIPLLLLTICCVFRYRRDRWILFAALLSVIAFVLSLGPILVVAGHQTSIPLPLDLVGKVPLVEDILPARFSLYETFFVTMIVALATAHVVRRDELQSRARSPRRTLSPAADLAADPSARTHPRPRIIAQLAVTALCVATVVSLVPRWPRVTAEVSSGMPPFFTSTAANQIPQGSVVLTFPFTMFPTDQGLLWQETDHWRWKLVGGYALIPYPGNQVSPMPPSLSPIAVQAFLGYWSTGQGGYLVWTPPPANSQLVAEVRRYVHNNGIGTVVFYSISPQSRIVLAVFERAFGKPISEGGVEIWLHLNQARPS
ncbi:MAG: hypothetical protein ABSD85_01320 [Acidimicrobiales bacterium]|jgi:hypothetical protein